MISPVVAKERLDILDIIRGIAILFIFIANIEILSFYSSLSQSLKVGLSFSSLNNILEKSMLVLIDRKFYTIFAMLFGIGFALQFHKFNSNKSGNFPIFFRRRMFGLLIIGFFHLFFLWYGDILFMYALMGFILIYFRNLPDKTILLTAITLTLIPVLNTLFFKSMGQGIVENWNGWINEKWRFAGLALDSQSGTRDVLGAMKNGDLLNQIKINLLMPFERYLGIVLEGRAFRVLGCFLLGFLVGKKIIYKELLNNKSLLLKALVWGFAIGFPMNILYLFLHIEWIQTAFNPLLKSLAYSLGVIPLAISYCALMVLMWNSGLFHRIFQAFAAAGRMALSNYLAQSIFAIILFYQIGFGIGGKTGPFLNILIAVSFYIFQTFISILWLNKFKYGPVEWLWRQYTYKKYLPLKK